jgi:hypothetical protein
MGFDLAFTMPEGVLSEIPLWTSQSIGRLSEIMHLTNLKSKISD